MAEERNNRGINPISLEEERWQQTLAALESLKAGRTIPAEQVFAWIRSWGTDNELPRPRAEECASGKERNNY